MEAGARAGGRDGVLALLWQSSRGMGESRRGGGTAGIAGREELRESRNHEERGSCGAWGWSSV